MPFQTLVNTQPAPAIEGDFASTNPRATVHAGPGGLVAGSAGVTVGRFAWVANDGVTVNTFADGPIAAPQGFVHRDAQALITNYLQESSLLIQPGFGVTLFNAGDFWARNRGAVATVPGMAVYARLTDGAVIPGSSPTGTTATGSIGATFTGVIAVTTGILTASAVTGYIAAGDTLAGSGIAAGATITSQISGTAGGVGNYQTSIVTAVASETMTSYGTTLNITAAAGTLAPGDAITGTGIPAGANIISQVSGTTGGVGIYTIDVPATAYAASTAITVAVGIVTNFVCASYANVNELVKISTWGA